ncbi:MAG: DUF1566 domain-containing protein [Treponema sp.]|jgi:hypothetical protein|nr:DUF1566 domain-containing protein [Treponema sp.]
MKKILLPGILAGLAMVVSTRAWTQSYYTGDGGKDITLVVYEPEGRELSRDENWLLPLVQGSFNTDFAKYSGITIFDRQNLERIMAQQTESASGLYSDEDYIRIGHLANARHILTGTITKTPNGAFSLQFSVSEVETGKRVASYGPASCSPLALENLSAVKKASADLLGQLGVKLTDAARRELSAEADTRQVQAETALSKGIEAAKKGTVVEALSYFFQAADFNPASTEVASRLNILNRDISSGNMGDNVRNDLQWHDQWKERLAEGSQFTTNYLKTPPAPSYSVIYTTNIQQGRIDYDTRTVEVSGVTVNYVFDGTALEAWTKQLQNVAKAVNDGLANTKRNGDWRLSPVQGRRNQDFSYTLTVSLLNDQGQRLSSQDVRLRGSWTADTERGFSYSLYDKEASVRFTGVSADLITDRLSVRFTAIDGKDAQTVARANNISIMTDEDYWKIIVPQNLRAAVAQGGKETLTWQGNTWDPRLKYRVYCTNPEGRISAVEGLVEGTRITVPSTYFGITRYWWVSCVDSNGRESGKSAATVSRIPLKVGDIGPGGGYVFYDKGDYSSGWRFLEAAPADLGTYTWDAAKRACMDYRGGGYSDWSLPEKDVLKLMYTNLRGNKGLGFSRLSYWSSSEGYNGLAWNQSFVDGIQGSNLKYYVYSVRAVRAF